MDRDENPRVILLTDNQVRRYAPGLADICDISTLEYRDINELWDAQVLLRLLPNISTNIRTRNALVHACESPETLADSIQDSFTIPAQEKNTALEKMKTLRYCVRYHYGFHDWTWGDMQGVTDQELSTFAIPLNMEPFDRQIVCSIIRTYLRDKANNDESAYTRAQSQLSAEGLNRILRGWTRYWFPAIATGRMRGGSQT